MEIVDTNIVTFPSRCNLNLLSAIINRFQENTTSIVSMKTEVIYTSTDYDVVVT